MRDEKLACFYITGELLLEMLKEKTDLPKDTKLVLVEEKKGQPLKDKRIKEFIDKKYPEGNENVITLIVTSKKFYLVGDDYYIPEILVKAKK